MYKWAIKQHCLFDKNGRDKKPTHDPRCKGNRGVLFSQSDHNYCRITAGHFKYQGRQGFQGNEKIFRRIDIKQANISETDTGFRSVDVDLFASRLCHQIPKYVSWQRDPHTWMVDAFQINWSLLKHIPPHLLLL